MNIDIVDGAPSKRNTLSLHRFCQKLYQDSGRSYVCVTVCHIDNAINLVSISSFPPLYLSRRYFWTETFFCRKRKQYIKLLQPSLISLALFFAFSGSWLWSHGRSRCVHAKEHRLPPNRPTRCFSGSPLMNWGAWSFSNRPSVLYIPQLKKKNIPTQ